MKMKGFGSAIFCLVLGVLMGKFMLDQYDSKEQEISTLHTTDTVYFIQQGVYSSKEDMEENINNVAYYIYNEQDGQYYAYIGMTLKSENVEKLQKYFKEVGYETYVKEFTISDSSFLEVLQQYDLMLEKTDDSNTISAICSQVLGKYEELVLSDEN